MFTGIIKNVSQVLKAEKKNGSLFLTIKKPKGWDIKLGDSISTDGVCLTIAKINKNNYVCELMTETLNKSYFGIFIPEWVNLEQSIKLGEKLDGHFVLGHIDTRGKIKSITKSKSGVIYKISFPSKYSRLVVSKGSIAIDGISLTVASITGTNHFSVSLIDYTLSHTSLGRKKAGDPVNLEFDILGKYLLKN